MPLKALVVDDHEASAKMLMWALEAAGYEAKAAFNSLSALEIIKSYIPDIVLSDINMPYMDGYELCKALRDDARLKSSLFIAQTGWNSDNRKKLSKIAGFHYHLVKPIDIEVLLSIIHKEFKSAKAS